MAELDPQLKIAASYAMNTAVTRFRKKPFSITDLELNVCRATLNGLDRINSADDIYLNFIQNNTDLNSIIGLSNGSDFESYEDQIGADYLSAYTTNVKTVYSVVTAAMALGSYVAGLNYDSFTGLLYGGYRHLNSVLGSGPTNSFYSPSQISVITGFNYSGVLSTIYEDSPMSRETEESYFRYYDLEPSFTTEINLSKIKDSAIQAYSISGELSYSAKPWDSLPLCEYIEIPVFPSSNPTVIGRYFYSIPRNIPCIEKERLISPITGIEFYRKFNDGPYSSGQWSESNIANSFHARDKTYLHKNSFRDNSLNLYSYNGEGLGTVVVDNPQGEMAPVLAREVAQQPIGGSIIEQHIGNYVSGRLGYSLSGYARGNIIPSAYEIYDVVSGHTGIHAAPFRLKSSSWSGTMNGIVSNPLLDTGRIYYSALNFHHSHLTGFLDASGIAGPPQRDYGSDFPYIVFQQNYDSLTAGKLANVNIHLGISASEVMGGVKTTFLIIETGSSSQFEDATNYTPDEGNQATVSFSYPINSTEIGSTGDKNSLIRGFALGMGNALDSATLYPYVISNNGYIHSGYLFDGQEIPFTTGGQLKLGNYIIVSGYTNIQNYSWGNTAFEGYGSYFSSGAIFGATQVIDTMLVGWTHPDYGEIPISPLYAYDGVDEYLYSGFDSGLSLTIADAEHFPPLGPADGFAKNPYSSGLLASGWYPVIKKQKRENSFPRYFRGPFSSSKKRFLYSAADLMYNSQNYKSDVDGLDGIGNKGSNIFVKHDGTNLLINEYADSGLSKAIGFPQKIIFDLNIKQYAKREFFRYDSYDAIGELSSHNYPGVSPTTITFLEQNSFSPTHAVDESYGAYDAVVAGKVIMPDSTKNPCIYDSPPNYVQGFISDEIGRYSGTNAIAFADWPFRDTGAYIVSWGNIIGYSFGPIYSDTGRMNPVGNFSRYTGYTVRITGYYTPPGYRLETSEYNPEPIYKALAPSRMFYEENFDVPPRRYGLAGSDPLYFRRIGNFTGVTANYWPDEELNGGQHPTGPSGLVGDSWIGFYSGRRIADGSEYGYGNYQVNDISTQINRRRNPIYDNRVLIPDVKPSGLGLYFAALEYFPGGNGYRKTYQDFSSETGYFKSGFYREMSGPAFDYAGKIFSYTGGMESGRLYQIPSGVEWVPISGVQPSATGWQKTNRGQIFHWRQQCQMDLSISNVVWSGYGDVPYDVEHLVMPTGSCNIAGIMKYEHLTEKPIYSEGLFLTDATAGDVVKTNSFYPQFLSDVLKEHGYVTVVPANSEIQSAPSKQMELNIEDARNIYSTSFKDINTLEKSYNKYIVGAISDYAYLNSTVMPSYDGKPIADGSMMPATTMLYSACQGQIFPDGTVNPSIVKKYEVTDQKQYFDGELTAAASDSRFMDGVIPIWEYIQPDNGSLFPKGITWTEHKKGLY